MFTYAVARAVNEGWINKTYMTIAQDGWKGLTSKITAGRPGAGCLHRYQHWR